MPALSDERPAARSPEPAAETLSEQAAQHRMRELCREHTAPLMGFLLRRVQGSRHLAEDLLQETLLRAWRHIHVLPEDTKAMGPWLYTVARRVAIDAARARQVRPQETAIQEAVAQSVSDEFERIVITQVVRDALAKLSPGHRAVLIELYFRQCSISEAATRLGIPEGTVKSRAYHAVRALNTAIAPND